MYAIRSYYVGGNKYSANPTLVGEWPESYASMGITAELVAQRYQVSRDDQDAFACSSHQKAAKAQAEGRFDAEIIPVEVDHAALVGAKMTRQVETVSADDGVRAVITAYSIHYTKLYDQYECAPPLGAREAILSIYFDHLDQALVRLKSFTSAV